MPHKQQTALLADELARRPFHDRKRSLTWEPPWEPPWGIEPQTYALRACHLRCSQQSNPDPRPRGGGDAGKLKAVPYVVEFGTRLAALLESEGQQER